MTGALPAELNARLARLRGAIRRRAILIVTLVASPLALVATALAYRLADPRAALLVAGVSVACWLAFAVRRARTHDAMWLARRLDAVVPDFEDSTALALAGISPAAELPRTDLERLQQRRVQRRLAHLSLPDLRPAWPRRTLATAWTLALLLLALAVIAPPLLSRWQRSAVESATPLPTATSVRAGVLTITPPPYTGLSPREVASLDAQAPAGSRIAWTVEFDRTATAVALRFHDGTRLDLRAERGVWRGEHMLEASILYGLVLEGAPPIQGDPLYRLDAIPDRAPEVSARAPEQTLNMLTAGQRTWDVAFDASDDYGLGDARLAISLAQGSGEQVTVTSQEIVLDGGRDPHRRRYRRTVDLEALGFAEGDDLIVRLSVADNRDPEPNVTTSASYVLRWRPEPSGDTAGMEGIVQRVMPAYFRSQRQIIIDTEALIAERHRLDATHFEGRADELGVDQKILRLRYGQFLGEEFESGAEEEQPWGHQHDLPEAATLLDPETKRLLRLALQEMWQSELHLRQAQPDLALPYEYKALDYIKQVQQAERIYLARTGVELPQVDETRRLGGKREGLSDRAIALPDAVAPESPVTRAWNALAHGGKVDLEALQSWARTHEASLPDAIGLWSAIARSERDPQCAECRAELEARLWPLLPAPATGVTLRPEPDAAGAAWVDALSRLPQ